MTREIMDSYETRQKQLEQQLKEEKAVFDKFKSDTQAIIDWYKLEISRLQSSNDEKELHNKTLADMLLDKNPAVLQILADNTKMMEEQTFILKGIQKRNEGINEASVEHTGMPIMVPSPTTSC